MEPVLVKVKKLHPSAIIPDYQSEGAACFDLHSVDGNVIVCEGNPKVLGTGLSFEIPKNHVMLIFSRSGSAFKNDTRLSNCVGVIDSDYRGEVKVKLTRDTANSNHLHIETGDRIAQAMIIPLPLVTFVEENELSETVRGENGLGSTGQ